MIDASRQCSMTGTMTPSGRSKWRIGRSVRESICSRPMAYAPRPPAVRVGLMPYLSEFHQGGLALTPLSPLALAPRPAHVFSDFESSQLVPRQVDIQSHTCIVLVFQTCLEQLKRHCLDIRFILLTRRHHVGRIPRKEASGGGRRISARNPYGLPARRETRMETDATI